MTRVRLIARDNGAGLSRDLAILADALAGFEIEIAAIGQGALRRAIGLAGTRTRSLLRGLLGGAARGIFDVNLMLERVRAEYAPLARCNVLIPNPEWFDPRDRGELAVVDCVFVKTRHALPIFQALGSRTEFVGFTSLDRRDAEIAREPVFFHLGGRSRNKGTQALLDLWLSRPDWPTLTIVQRKPLRIERALPPNVRILSEYLDDGALRTLQNRHLFHLCPSETEGFGHHLVEATSVGAIVLTVDAPPMHEMIDATRGVLVGYARTGTQALATTYFTEPAALAAGVDAMLALDAGARLAMSEAARAWWEDNDRRFRLRLRAAIATLAASGA